MMEEIITDAHLRAVFEIWKPLLWTRVSVLMRASGLFDGLWWCIHFRASVSGIQVQSCFRRNMGLTSTDSFFLEFHVFLR